jgi:hypothetical protein
MIRTSGPVPQAERGYHRWGHTGDTYGCDGCGKMGSFTAGAYHCAPCTYDLCLDCAKKEWWNEKGYY